MVICCWSYYLSEMTCLKWYTDNPNTILQIKSWHNALKINNFQLQSISLQKLCIVWQYPPNPIVIQNPSPYKIRNVNQFVEHAILEVVMFMSGRYLHFMGNCNCPNKAILKLNSLFQNVILQKISNKCTFN